VYGGENGVCADDVKIIAVSGIYEMSVSVYFV
jgi:hypothetical protein